MKKNRRLFSSDGSLCQQIQSCLRAVCLVASALCLGLLFSKNSCKCQAAEFADLKITFVYDATEPPVRRRLTPLGDPSCLPESMMPLSETLIVDVETMGIQNVAMYLDPKNSDWVARELHDKLRKPPDKPSLMDVHDCVFEPHILIARVGQKMKLNNSDIYGHNPHFVFFANGPESRMHPPGRSVEFEFAHAEKAPSPVRCNIHPWMQAYVLVFDHPYTAISDRQGVLKIEKLPAGKTIHFKVWHESMEKSIEQVTLQGKPTVWQKGNLQLTLKPGANDLGIVKISPSQFKK